MTTNPKKFLLVIITTLLMMQVLFMPISIVFADSMNESESQVQPDYSELELFSEDNNEVLSNPSLEENVTDDRLLDKSNPNIDEESKIEKIEDSMNSSEFLNNSDSNKVEESHVGKDFSIYFGGSDIRYVNQNDNLSIDIHSSNSIDTFKISLPIGVELISDTIYKDVSLVETDTKGTKSYVITAIKQKKQFNIELLFTKNGTKQIAVEDELSGYSADFLFVSVGDNISRNHQTESAIRNSVTVSTAAQFVTAWNSTSREIITTPTRERTLSAKQIDSLNTLSRTLKLTAGSSYFFSPDPKSSSNLNLSRTGYLILDGNGSTEWILQRDNSDSIRFFNILGGSLELNKTSLQARSIDVETLILQKGGVLQSNNGHQIPLIAVKASDVYLTSNASTRADGQFLLEVTPRNNTTVNIVRIHIKAQYFYVHDRDDIDIGKAWENLEAVIENDNIVKSNHNGFNNDTFTSVNNYRYFTDRRYPANIYEPQQNRHSLTMISNLTEGGKPEAVSDKLTEGESTNIMSNTNEGYNFVRWEIVSGPQSLLKDPTDENTLFTMGNADATVQAVYEEIQSSEPVAPVDPLQPETEVSPENIPELPENQGLLSIDFVSQFDFGSHPISVHNQKYYAKTQKLLNEDTPANVVEERPNYIQISDRRPDTERNGWELSVMQKEQFKGLENQELSGASLSLLNQQIITAQGGNPPGLQSVPCELIPGNRRTLLKAQGDEGTGTWVYRFGDDETAEESVVLNVPKGTNPEATIYKTTLVWELSIVPQNQFD
ncbi:WxL domain-containing protein [Enterococcus casseliflavus]|uniref:WxL domain-containing protein n=1 Tax=Enterococcus casseliflavus TaxID=37734 RepID=UPI003EE3CD1F